MKYCPYTFKTKRFNSREVLIGNVGVGACHPIRIQSMTTSDTRDVEKTVEQIMRLADSGCEIARVTVQGMKEAFSCEKIKSTLIQKGYSIPLVADIHFFPKAAITVADFVDKVRINPGNYIDKRASFKVLEYSDQSYQSELNRLEDKFTPLVEKCKKRGVAIRIGTNHGSLSDRVMNRYGDSPKGMVESAIEFTEVCRKLDFHQIIYSMKASNTHVMIQAYRLLVARMMEMGWDYPLHLGVTEAGSGEDGRIKSAVGIGSLLLDGIGDTIRISLTEDPWFEIDPAKRLIALANQYLQKPSRLPFVEKNRNPFIYQKRTEAIENNPLHPDGGVFVSVSEEEILADSFENDLGFEINEGELKLTHTTVDGVWIEKVVESQVAVAKIRTLKESGLAILSASQPFLNTHSFTEIAAHDSHWKTRALTNSNLLILTLDENKVHFAREVVEFLQQQKIQTPVMLKGEYALQPEDLQIHAGAEFGSLLCDGLANGLLINASTPTLLARKNLSFNLLQAARLRSSKTEFISCPSCGRTLFDLQTVTQKIQERTAHLPGVKIAVMGCIVNGPGEMADADFGYVGSKPGLIDLYVGKERVEKDIDYKDAVESLVDLLKKHDRWVEPKKLDVVLN